MQQIDAGLLALRVVFGLSLAYHGYNKVFGDNGLTGTAKWFEFIGMKWPKWQARIAATTEIGSGVLFAAGLITPVAAAGMIGIMVVAMAVAHWKVGYFIFKEGGGWEYCAAIAVVALAVATAGAGRWSLDHALKIEIHSWWGTVVAAALGIGGALMQLAICYRRPTPSP